MRAILLSSFIIRHASDADEIPGCWLPNQFIKVG
jgi:hypothetical protein